MGRGAGQGAGTAHHSRTRELGRARAESRQLDQYFNPALPQDEGATEMTAMGTFTDTTSNATLRDVLARLEKEGAALGHFNISDQTLVKAVFAAAEETKLPVIIGASEGEREFLGARPLAALVKSLRQETDLPVFLNADHTDSLAKAVEAAKAGFDSVVIDFSALPIEENVARTKKAGPDI